MSDSERIHLLQADLTVAMFFASLPNQLIDRAFSKCSCRNSDQVKMRPHICPLLAPVQWLTVAFRVDLEVILLVFKALNGFSPKHISDCSSKYVPNRALRSSSAGLHTISKVKCV